MSSSIKLDLKKYKKPELIQIGLNRGIHFISTAKKQNIINGLSGKPSRFIKIKKPTKEAEIDFKKIKKSDLFKLGLERNIYFPSYTKKQNMINTLSSLVSPFYVEKPKVRETSFNGSTIMRYINILYLTIKRDNLYSSLNSSHINNIFLRTFNTEYIGYYNNNLNPKSSTYINAKSITEYKKSKKQFYILPIYIGWNSKKGHVNSIIYNKKTKELEYFEPYGLQKDQDFLLRRNMMEGIKNDLVSKGLLIKSINYISKDLPGPQHFNSQEQVCKGDPWGFCQVWSFWFIDYRVKHYNKNANELVQNFLDKFIKDQIPFKNFIRNYGEQIVLFMKYNTPNCTTKSKSSNKKCVVELKKLYSKIFKT